MKKPDVVAPGTDIVSCNAGISRRGRYYRNAYIAKSGTSMATPMVAGAAALAFQSDPRMTNESCKQRLQYSATDLGLAWNRQGWGLLNVQKVCAK